ncbi:MAG TPA: metallophosphoesterase [Bacteroidales bacterium]|jgi:hypothetical protein|nr:metallophosphoesterase [Bacteroidales bacterium]
MKVLFKKAILFLIGILIVLGCYSINPNDKLLESNNPETGETFESSFFGKKSITDGPYIFYENDQVKVKWIYRNREVERTIKGDNFNIIKRKFGFEFKKAWIDQNKADSINYIQNFSGVKNLIAISDVHGQYEVFIKLLKEHGIIDKHFNWIFGKGHLVVLGDIMDRGPRVTETFWLIYKLEQQAKQAGGMVHFILGNHELMVLNNDIRYINEKYIESAQRMNTTYSQIYSENSFLGKWLRKKPVVITINDMLFVHAGISTEFINKGFTVKDANSIFIHKIVGKSWDSILKDSTLSFMMDDKGPIWFRGYFIDNRLKESEIDSILHYFDKTRILVGHTSLPNITLLYHGKVFGIDSNIKEGDYGEVLIYENGTFYRGTLLGGRIKF